MRIGYGFNHSDTNVMRCTEMCIALNQFGCHQLRRIECGTDFRHWLLSAYDPDSLPPSSSQDDLWQFMYRSIEVFDNRKKHAKSRK